MPSRSSKIFRSKFLLVVLALVLVSAGAVYAGTRLDDDGKRRSGAPSVREDRSLTQQPRPLTLEEVAKAGKGTPQGVVLGLWYWTQWGSAPNVLDAYDPAVVRRVGAANLTGAYSIRRAPALVTRLDVVDVRRTGRDRATVTVEALRKNTVPETYSFSLRRRGGRWGVTFDTFLESAIAAYVQTRRSPDPEAKPPRDAVRAGLEAAREYRIAFLCSEAGNPRRAAAVDRRRDC